MAFLKVAGVSYECGPSNGLNNLMKQLGKDRSPQQVRFSQGESSKVTNGFRSHKSHAQTGDKLAEEFFQKESKACKNQNLQSLFTHNDWVRDFTPHTVDCSPIQIEEFEQIYQGPSCASPINQWSDDFSKFHSRQTSSDCSEEQIAFEKAFEEILDVGAIHHHDWDKEFANHETLESHYQPTFQPAMTNDSFGIADADFNNLPIQDKSPMPIVEIEPELVGSVDRKKWNRLRPDGIAYGYSSIHPDYDVYIPTKDNPYMIRRDAIDGMEHTTLADSILALEAKVQLNPNDAKTWEELGLKQQENERDRAAIAALERAVLLDPNCLDAWLALAIAYRNEHCRMDAFNCLEQWIANNSRYKDILREELGVYHKDGIKRHDYITNVFLEAARTSPGSEEMDADVQVGLGVIFNMSEDFNKAMDCFKAALLIRPDDYQLWNKVGATLANVRDNSGAIEMYMNAIQINPLFVRARYNLAISYMNLGQHQEAAENLLSSLSLQHAAALSINEIHGGVPTELHDNTSSSMWDSLRLLMYMMNHEDLASQCDFHHLEAFRGYFNF